MSVLESQFCFQHCAQVYNTHTDSVLQLPLHTLPFIPGETADPSAFIVSITSHSHFGRPKCLHVFVNKLVLFH